MQFRVLFLAISLLLLGVGSALAEVSEVRIVGDGAPTRITIWSDMEPSHAAFLSESDGQRAIIVPFSGVDTSLEGTGAGGIAAWTVENERLTFVLDQPMMIARVLSLPPTGSATQHRIILDLETVSTARYSSVAKRDRGRMKRYLARANKKDQPALPVPAVIRPVPRAPDGSRKYVIVIDPGHGGKDPGALAVTHGFEKTITLKAAKMLKEQLEKSRRYEVRLTRDDDTFIELEDRVSIARAHGADLFISLHADAAANKTVEGASIYTISASGEKRINSEASKNNWRMPIEDGTSKEVGGILEDLIKRETKTRSAEFAEILLPELKQAGPVLRRTHRNAGFYVLLAPDVPAVLVELGFLTNAKDAKRLQSKRGLKKSVRAVKQGIDKYFDRQDMLYAQH
jgi:N-acetylmuramoyl-L-alanine amidase